MDKSIGNIIYYLACKIKPQIMEKIPFLAQYIDKGKIDSTLRLDCALDYLLRNIEVDTNVREFEKACGIGVVITPEEIEKEVEKCIYKYKNEILKKR